MARTTMEVRYGNLEVFRSKTEGMLQQKGYHLITENNENVWKCGSGIVTAMKYLKIEYVAANTVQVSGWIKNMGMELGLEGVVGALPKEQIMSVIREIMRIGNESMAGNSVSGIAPVTMGEAVKSGQWVRTTQEKRFCGNCGNMLKENHKFCTNCGAKV